ncbi:putative leucine-rich repeat receptor-like serine/threonine-protein kinase At2g24130 [Cornus florida]|uniref:putative leucine-rich repeat receptor-like serine/threonine-protein kinase At2g24130 n=1 Tax=Cornus florida TaxID=4283 RepID=UPI00289ED85A|nr:putative leucine-rich repeat receptor-like serine/threonine-protein kinase At2g24130 [Cornus florida]
MVFKRTIFLFLLLNFFIVSDQALSAYHHHNPPYHSLETDKIALLAFKRTIISDPNSSLANWNETNYVCNFTGVRCNKQWHRVTRLNLNGSALVGLLSPFISNLTRLRFLQLVDNNLYGNIPPEFSSLRHLIWIKLDGNKLYGQIPDFFSFLSHRTFVSMRNNSLTGTLPASFFSNCTSLGNVDLSYNFLNGNIPPEIGNCPILWNLNLYNNQFTGEFPFSMSNLSNMYNLDVEYNNFTGELPSEIVGKWTFLVILHLSNNKFVSHDLDPFFTALTNCTILAELELAGMDLGGKLPSSIGQLAELEYLYLQENKIFGSIPSNLANLTNLVLLNLTSNLLNGISAEISGLPFLEQLFLSHNKFTGTIPVALGQLPHLGLLDLSNNTFSGEIPEFLGNLTKINFLFLNNNLLSGVIPGSLGQCRDLAKLDLSYNRLTGGIPLGILGIHEIRIFLNLSHNHLEGPLPIELSKLENVQEIDLSSNYFTGSIFPQISNCLSLRLLNFSHNSLRGQLPDSLGDLKSLEAFDVSGNHLSGKIPTSLNKIQTLTFLNLSYNNFNGRIPSDGIFKSVTNLSFLGNENLCGFPGLRNCHRKLRNYFRSHLIVFCIVISVSVFLSTISCVIVCRRLQRNISSGEAETVSQSPPEPIHNFPRITYKELSEATGGFDQQRLLGSGSYGHVYKGVLPDGTPIAVKVLHMQTGNSTKSFNRECQVLKRIRHRNLIRIITACSLPDFKALVLPYMANGSLDSRLYPHSGTGLASASASGSSDLSLIQRVNICSDIAEGMAYLHHHSPVRVVHCDLKPSNVLLNDDLTALVSDFGISRLVAGVENAGVVENMGNSTANMLCGSIGYIAPEYGFGSITSTKGDVYSFGILVLEMVTRRRPTDDMFGGGLSLHKWVKSQYHGGRMEKVVDSSLVRALRDESPEVKKMWEVAIGELIELGILCTQESAPTRPTMLDAADDLDRLKRYLNGDTTATFTSSLGISSSTLGDD